MILLLVAPGIVIRNRVEEHIAAAYLDDLCPVSAHTLDGLGFGLALDKLAHIVSY